MAQPAAVRPARRLFDAAKDDGGDGYDCLLTELDDLLRGANPNPPPGGIDGTLPGCESGDVMDAAMLHGREYLHDNGQHRRK